MDPPRMLAAISITPTVAQAANGQTQVQFVATGTFTEPPITVTPLAVSWNFANTPLTACLANNCAQITSQGVAMCGNLDHGRLLPALRPTRKLHSTTSVYLESQQRRR